MAVFDDVFVDDNVCSGLAVGSDHRQTLHELILGAQGVTLNRRLQQLVERIETHNSELRTRAAAIPAGQRGNLSVDQFCVLLPREEIELEIRAAERRLAAARQQEAIRTTLPFEDFSLPSFDTAAIEEVLGADLPSLDAAAAARVQTHLAALGSGGEAWVADGMRRIGPPRSFATAGSCPFCDQDLRASHLFSHYRTYFSDAYVDLNRMVSQALDTIDRAHGADVPSAFERWARVTAERGRFWATFCDVPDVRVDTAAVARDWQEARRAIRGALVAKQAAPLESLDIGEETLNAVRSFDRHREALTTLNRQLQQEANAAIRLVKEQAASGNAAALAADLAGLQAIKARHEAPTAALCEAYLAEAAAKEQTERLRDATREQLEALRATAFPACQAATNVYLQRFNASFRLDSVTAANTRGGSTCTYNVVVNNTAIPVGGTAPGQPSFRSTLSAGDRNTLALAFFFASLDPDPNYAPPALATKIVVVDDPISSLDEHRALTTVQEVRRLAQRAGQVIVLSHSKPFLCRIWENADPANRCAIEVRRDAQGSSIREWDVRQDCITEHDRRHAMLRTYVANGSSDSRDVAQAIRPVLEAFARVAYPEHFPPGTLLGPFLHTCEARVGTAGQILAQADVVELRHLLEYANRFHHDTNAAWETEGINDGELTAFVQRTLDFAKRPPGNAVAMP
ncbi:MAG: AAA family ATPase [Acidobacteriota bacterium]